MKTPLDAIAFSIALPFLLIYIGVLCAAVFLTWLLDGIWHGESLAETFLDSIH